MSQFMTNYSWQHAFDSVKEEGPQRVVRFFKIGLLEMARLEKELASSHVQTLQLTLEEVRSLLDRINIEMSKTMQESTLSNEAFIKELKKTENFTSEEWDQLKRVPDVLGQNFSKIYETKDIKPPYKKNPRFKV